MSTADFTPADLAELFYGVEGDLMRPLVILYLECYGEPVTLDVQAALDLLVNFPPHKPIC